MRVAAIALSALLLGLAGSSERAPWVPDLGDGRYRNPILFADYSDPDAIRVGDDFYLTASSFNAVPGLPILHSKDLVGWRLINHALKHLVPEASFATPQHGGGVWAPCLRFHQGRYLIYYGDPDHGIHVVTAADPAGAWSEPVLVKPGRGLIDPTPLFDDDGRAWLLHAWAKSRAGFNNVLTLHELSADGLHVIDAGRVVIDGDRLPGYRTLEGPKLYKRNGWYWVFAPAGGVREGWQSAFRARSIQGPYEDRIVLAQGGTPVNGPHQGALVETASGESWFLHFQDRGAYGRIVHLQPTVWKDGWPVMGSDPDGDGTGEPVPSFRKPQTGAAQAVVVPATSDAFVGPRLGLQWQWPANPRPEWYSLTQSPGALRLRAQPAAAGNLHAQANLLLQKLPAPELVVETSLRFAPAAAGEKAGLIVFGDSYAWIGVEKAADGLRVRQVVANDARAGGAEVEAASAALRTATVGLRVEVREGARCQFSYSEDGVRFTPLGESFQATVGRWIGSKVGLFAVAAAGAKDAGHADFESFEVAAIESSRAAVPRSR
jgi:beta-xylosidase